MFEDIHHRDYARCAVRQFDMVQLRFQNRAANFIEPGDSDIQALLIVVDSENSASATHFDQPCARAHACIHQQIIAIQFQKPVDPVSHDQTLADIEPVTAIQPVEVSVFFGVHE